MNMNIRDFKYSYHDVILRAYLSKSINTEWPVEIQRFLLCTSPRAEIATCVSVNYELRARAQSRRAAHALTRTPGTVSISDSYKSLYTYNLHKEEM